MTLAAERDRTRRLQQLCEQTARDGGGGLDLALQGDLELGPRLAAAEAAAAAQQRHIERLAAEVSKARAEEGAARERAAAQRSLCEQLQVELRRVLEVQAAAGSSCGADQRDTGCFGGARAALLLGRLSDASEQLRLLEAHAEEHCSRWPEALAGPGSVQALEAPRQLAVAGAMLGALLSQLQAGGAAAARDPAVGAAAVEAAAEALQRVQAAMESAELALSAGHEELEEQAAALSTLLLAATDAANAACAAAARLATIAADGGSSCDEASPVLASTEAPLAPGASAAAQADRLKWLLRSAEVVRAAEAQLNHSMAAVVSPASAPGWVVGEAAAAAAAAARDISGVVEGLRAALEAAAAGELTAEKRAALASALEASADGVDESARVSTSSWQWQ